ncbi:hypothetical protein BH23ACT5_BH23ACT5_03710 [soil metagenome]
MTTPTRRILGVAAVALVAGGAWWLFASPEGRAGGILVRAGLLAGAAWLVAPLVRRPAPATIAFGVALLAVVARPRLIVVVVVAALVWRYGTRRRRPTGGPSPP